MKELLLALEGGGAKTHIRLPGTKKPIQTTFQPHEIKTLRIARKTKRTKETNLLEE